MITSTANKFGTRVRFTRDLHLYGITTISAGTTGIVTSDNCQDEEPCFLVLPDDREVRNDLEEWGGRAFMPRGWEDYLELDEPSALPPR
jgi:hypothetical protein